MLSSYDPQTTAEMDRTEQDLELEVESARNKVVKGLESRDRLLSLTAGSFGLDLAFVSKAGHTSVESLSMLYRRFWRKQNEPAGIELKWSDLRSAGHWGARVAERSASV